MTQVYLYKREGHFSGFELSGHAGYGEHGSDIVCSAVSILSMTCVNALTELLKLKVTIKADEKKGKLKCMLPAKISDVQKEHSDLLIGQMKLGLVGIADMYPEHVTVETREV